MKGCVFNVQHFSVHDGPGIRTIIFLKGCPLRCAWCANPESQEIKPQIAYNRANCIGAECLLCQRVCNEKAIFYPGEAAVEIQFQKCTKCMKCATFCPSKAITAYGEFKSVEDLIDQVEEDIQFYNTSNGGLTLSGGEIALQHDFALALLKEARRRKIHTAIETCGYAEWEALCEIVKQADYVLYDIKVMDDEKHFFYTGAHNQLILENFKKMRETFPKKNVRVRTPVIPGVNSTDEDIRQIRDFIMQYPNTEYELLKYHRFGTPKYDYLGKKYKLGDADLSDSQFEKLKKIASYEVK